MTRFGFLVETYETERLKTLSVWSQFEPRDLIFRPAARARSVVEQMIHQCLSEDAWFTKMLGISVSVPPLPPAEDRAGLVERYATASGERLHALQGVADPWFEAPTQFFAVERSRAWVLVRRVAHSAHHRGQLTTYLRLLGRSLYSTYGPTADTGGLPTSGATVVYRYPSVDALLEGERYGGVWPSLPVPTAAPVTERPIV